MIKRTFFVIKHNYGKLLSKFETADVKIEIQLDKISKAILDLNNARTQAVLYGDETLVKSVEEQITKLNDKYKELEKRKAEFVAKSTLLKTKIDLAKTTMKYSKEFLDLNFIDAEIKKLEAELDTLNFSSKL